MKSAGSKINLVCYDDFRWFSEDLKTHFDSSAYITSAFINVEEFMLYIEKNHVPDYCRIAILGAHDTTENFEMIGRLSKEIKNIDPSTGIILIGTHDKMEEIRKIIPSGIDAYIPKNNNLILRLKNAVQKLVSAYNVRKSRRRRNLAFLLFAFLGIVIITLSVIALIKLPGLF